MKATALDYGLKDETIEAPALWGARLVLEGSADPRCRQACTVFDRQSIASDDDNARMRLVAFLDGKPYEGRPEGPGALGLFLDYLTRELRADRLDPAGQDKIDRTLGGVRFQGSPRGSYGYFYVTACVENIPTCRGCGKGADNDTLAGTKTYPGLCRACREVRTSEKRAKRARRGAYR